MNKQQPFSRQFLAIIIFILYLCPFLILALSLAKDLEVLSLGLLISVIGSIILFLMVRNWQNSFELSEEPKAPVLAPEPIFAPPQEIIKDPQLLEELELKKEEMLKIEREKNQLLQQTERMEREKHEIEQRAQDLSEESEKYHKEYLKTISQQRELLEQQEGEIAKLENQVRDLNYEIKALVDFGNTSDIEEDEKIEKELLKPATESQSQIPAPLFQLKQEKKIETPQPIEADLQLKRCLDIAQKITGRTTFGSENSRFRDLSVNNYSIDLRHLLDSLRSENSNTILLYSQKEEKLLFVNNQTKGLLGWSPEKFVQEFPSIIQEGVNDWKTALNQVAGKGETKVKMVLKNKSGQNVSVHCHLGSIPTGVFRHDVIGVLYPT